MTPSMMLESLQEYLQEITKEMFLGPDRLRPNIYKVDLPARATPYNPVQETLLMPETDIPVPNQQILPDEQDERWPFIIIVWNDSEDNEEGNRSTRIDFSFGCEGSGSDGYMDVLHLMEFVRISFLRETWDGWPFRIERPLTMGFYDEQADPYWTGYMSTTWEIPTIVQEVRFF
ncbi:hypothetical protein [Paenibacillus macquariensis]|uniref:Uncharacterized protein n=1 Tax=Paenibacillus macquariensis TaxID=948756 RepID=A0ABY1K750_9BACL|nr:hypothetical protein [Paenibacillus macquariensis]MEC0092498.1 hypothetical protein [Paenibacillus macquariensis]OAB35456.1 hypothetical protein PMSM_09375 [Paenibacillus macquariensis subsp. macquariensis]SIR35361.1 hypothetical protein SAMN05421578_111168 [Paenibacillus macquariensis]